MSKNKYFVIFGIFAVILIIGGGGIWYWQTHRAKDTVSFGTEAQNVSSQDTSSTSQSQNPGALGVTSASGATNLGQLGAGQQQTRSSSGGAQGSPSSTGGGSSTSSEPNPATFAEYEKYKDAKAALFGDIKVGSGTELTANHKAAVVYKGWLTNGQLFDQSRTGSDGKIQPFVFTVGSGQVIPGWDQGVAGMKVGGTRLIIVPPVVGYGTSGQGPIPGNAVLVFEVQLVDVQ